MIVYIFNEYELFKFNLPIAVSGMFPININDKLIGNIIAENNSWNFQFSIEYTSNGEYGNKETIKQFKIYNIVSDNKKISYYCVVTPKYEESSKKYQTSTEFTIGNDGSCSICYPLNLPQKDILTISPAENGSWILKTESNHFYVCGKKAIGETKLHSGDYIFYFGLKIIIINNIIIVNQPSTSLKVNNGTLKEYTPINTDATEMLDINDENLPVFSKEEYFYKAPRLNFIINEETVIIDEPPQPEREDETPTIMVIGPQITMLSTTVISLVSYVDSFIKGDTNITKFIVSLVTVIVTISGTLLWPTITRKYAKKRLKSREIKRQEKYIEYLTRKKKTLDLIRNSQRDSMISNNPSAEQCINIINGKANELWQRNIDHEDFLAIRLGIGKTYTRVNVNVPEERFHIEEEDKLFVTLKTILDETLTIDNVPVTYNFSSNGINAIVGTNKLVKEFLDCVFLQMMTFHAYTDLKIVSYTSEPDKWDYLKITPHCWDNQKTARYFATTVEELSTISATLEKIFDARVANDEEVLIEDDGNTENRKVYANFKPYYLFFIDDITSARNVSLINKIIRYKKNVGFSIIITSKSISTLPSETNDFICVGENESAIMTSKINDNQKLFQADYNSDEKIDIYACAQKLANIPILVEKEKYELPSSLSFLEMYNVGRVEQLNSVSRWSENNPVLSLAVPVGIDQNGEIFKMDIHEKAYGPHGLVAGTTGSGKSEWIVTYILSLAVNFNPDELQFVLIDYKGGGLAKSFENEELNIKLPHLAGTITNLDKSEINRSISAIESELKRRQSVFNAAREKLKEGSMNIYKYQQCYRKGLVDEPMSHLIIICDEFAEMKQQQPEFMEQLISTSRIGRSLGIHLILATQKPSGVVNEQIWSNSKFKVCLKVQDKGDSNEMIKKPDAAFLKQTGAFYLQVGNDDYFNLGQSAWAGAKYYPSDIIKKRVDDSIVYIDNLGRTSEVFEEKDKVVLESEGEELINIVSYISEISKTMIFKSAPLWLDNIKPNILLSTLLKKYNYTKPGAFKYTVPIGEYDEPRRQEQGLLTIDLSAGHVAILNQGKSGAESLISTLIWSTLCDHSPYEVAFYIIDFGAETMKKFAKFPQVGEVVFQDDIEKVGGILDLIYEEVDKRKSMLSDYNGSLELYNKENKNKLPLIFPVINNFDVFMENFPKVGDIFNSLFREASKYGIVFILSGSPTCLRTRQLQYFPNVIMMNLSDDLQYRSISNCRKGLIPKKIMGRGLCKLDSSITDSYCEFQTALIYNEEEELNYIKEYADKCINFYKYKVKQLATIPEDVSSKDLASYATSLEAVPIGYDFYDKSITKYNIIKQKILVITGRKIAENVSFLYGLANILTKISNVNVRVIDFLNIFQNPILDIKFFNESLPGVIKALEDDSRNRKESQDYSINLIIGAAQVKRKFKDSDYLFYENMLNNAKNSKKNIYVLIDDYDKIRTIKLEKWFEDIDMKNAIWIGNNMTGQSLIQSDEISNEEKKYSFFGMCNIIEDGKHKLIKAIMDMEE